MTAGSKTLEQLKGTDDTRRVAARWV